jgi:2-amino-4-hydroxy-6-hydroxymethyldihydropteridine diphosphokinase
VRAYVAIGSNIEPAANVRLAMLHLAKQVLIANVSMVYRTAALGRPEQDPYYNCVVAIETDMAPLELRRCMRAIEEALGRRRNEDKYAARTIDLDLIVYGDNVLDAEGLKLPDPEIMERPFLAIPLWELAPSLVLAGSGRPIAEVAAGMKQEGMQPLREYALELRLALETDIPELRA